MKYQNTSTIEVLMKFDGPSLGVSVTIEDDR